MHASFDALMTVFKGHLVAAACVELGIDNPESDFPLTTSTYSVHVSDIAAKIVENFTIVSEAVLGLPLPDCQDRVYNYARVLCHRAGDKRTDFINMAIHKSEVITPKYIKGML